MYQEIFLHTILRFYPTERLLEIGWADYVNATQFRQTVERALELAEQFRARHWLANDTRLRPPAPAERIWLLDTVVSRLGALGLHRVAAVHSLDPATQVIMREFADHLQPHVPTRLFGHRPGAWAWLTEQITLEGPPVEGKRLFSATVKFTGRPL